VGKVDNIESTKKEAKPNGDQCVGTSEQQGIDQLLNDLCHHAFP
jgi:hypothetical protein